MTTVLRQDKGPMGLALRRLDGLRLAAPRVAELEQWAEHLRIVRNLSPYTVASYLDAAGGFQAWLAGQGVAGLEEATPAHVSGWQKWLFVVGHVQASSRGQRLSALRGFFSWRELEGAPGNPARPVKGPKKTQRMPRKYSDAQISAMFRACDRTDPVGTRDFAALMVLYTTGLRRFELVGLAMHQVHLQARVGRLQVLGKGAKERVVPFAEPTVAALQAWFAVRERIALDDPDAVWVTLSRSGAGRALQRSGVERIVGRAKRRAGVRTVGQAVHAWRVTFATDLYDEFRDIERVRILLGHESIDTTRRYIAISRTHLSTKMPAKRIRELTGEQRRVPLWLQKQIDQRSDRDRPG